jgi:hypothetical protein
MSARQPKYVQRDNRSSGTARLLDSTANSTAFIDLPSPPA